MLPSITVFSSDEMAAPGRRSCPSAPAAKPAASCQHVRPHGFLTLPGLGAEASLPRVTATASGGRDPHRDEVRDDTARAASPEPVSLAPARPRPGHPRPGPPAAENASPPSPLRAAPCARAALPAELAVIFPGPSMLAPDVHPPAGRPDRLPRRATCSSTSPPSPLGETARLHALRCPAGAQPARTASTAAWPWHTAAVLYLIANLYPLVGLEMQGPPRRGHPGRRAAHPVARRHGARWRRWSASPPCSFRCSSC